MSRCYIAREPECLCCCASPPRCGKPDTKLRGPLELKGFKANGTAANWGKASLFKEAMRALKQVIRNRLRHSRRQLTTAEQLRLAQKIKHRLSQQSFYKKAQHIGLYFAFDGEISTLPILEQALQLHKSCYAPIVTDSHLEFIKFDLQTPMVKNRFGILEPAYPQMRSIPLRSLDVVLVPVVAFDKHCYRLGMGAGFYDITFAFKRREKGPRLIGLAYDFQKIFSVPRSKLDLKLDGVVSERAFYSQQII